MSVIIFKIVGSDVGKSCSSEVINAAAKDIAEFLKEGVAVVTDKATASVKAWNAIFT